MPMIPGDGAGPSPRTLTADHAHSRTSRTRLERATLAHRRACHPDHCRGARLAQL